MPTRQTLRRRHDPARLTADVLDAYLVGDGTAAYDSTWTRTAGEAARGWPAYRRACWLRTPRLMVPGGAVHDGLTVSAFDAARWVNGYTPSFLAEGEAKVRAALEADRAAVAAFRRRAPTAAREIADVLDLLLGDLDQLEALLPALLAEPGAVTRWRPTPAGPRYGDALGLLAPDEE